MNKIINKKGLADAIIASKGTLPYLNIFKNEDKKEYYSFLSSIKFKSAICTYNIEKIFNIAEIFEMSRIAIIEVILRVIDNIEKEHLN